MTNCLFLIFVIFALEKAILVTGRHRHGQTAECSKCSPGESLSKRCNRRHDSECTPCPFGSYQPHHSYKRYCYLCSKCGDGLYIAHACTSVSDTVCDSCHTYRGPHNDDYQQKCQVQHQEMTSASLNEEISWTSDNYGLNAVFLDDEEVKTNRRSVLTIVVVGIIILICFVVLFFLSSRWCRADRKMAKPGYRYQVINTREPVML